MEPVLERSCSGTAPNPAKSLPPSATVGCLANMVSLSVATGCARSLTTSPSGSRESIALYTENVKPCDLRPGLDRATLKRQRCRLKEQLDATAIGGVLIAQAPHQSRMANDLVA
jgi:hypothetical protein